MNKENVAQHNFSLQARVRTPNSYSNGFIMHNAEGMEQRNLNAKLSRFRGVFHAFFYKFNIVLV